MTATMRAAGDKLMPLVDLTELPSAALIAAVWYISATVHTSKPRPIFHMVIRPDAGVLTPAEQQTIAHARSLSSPGMDKLLAVIDRLTGGAS